MLQRNSLEVQWRYSGPVADLANVIIPAGNENAGFDVSGGTVAAVAGLMPTLSLPFFSIDVLTDDAIVVVIDQGPDPAALTAFVSLTCAVGLAHNTVYDLPPPHNKDGFLILTSPWTRIRITNNTGGIVDPVELVARSWR